MNSPTVHELRMALWMRDYPFIRVRLDREKVTPGDLVVAAWPDGQRDTYRVTDAVRDSRGGWWCDVEALR